MQSESPLRVIQSENKGRDILKTMNQIVYTNDSNRRTSIRLKDLSSGKKEHQNLQKLKLANSPPSSGMMKTNTLIKQKSLQQLKTETYTQKKISSKDLDGQNNIKQGDTYKSISPKVVINKDKINVYFVKEMSKFHMTAETKPKTENNISSDNQMQEITQQRVYMKGPQQPQSSNRGPNNQSMIPKSCLSNHKSLLQAQAKKILRKQI